MFQWSIKKFEEFSAAELYEILKLRQQVFVVEQECPYLDADGKDYRSVHVMGYLDDMKLMAYARILPPIPGEKEVHVGRVCTHESIRKTGAGKELMRQTLAIVNGIYLNYPIVLSAQVYLQTFYEFFGFRSEGNSYLEDGIPHIRMVMKD